MIPPVGMAEASVMSSCKSPDSVLSMTTVSLYASGSNHKVNILSYKQDNKGLTYAL